MAYRVEFSEQDRTVFENEILVLTQQAVDAGRGYSVKRTHGNDGWHTAVIVIEDSKETA